MKRSIFIALLVGVIAVVAGCPVYSNDGDHRFCEQGICYICANYYDAYDCAELFCDRNEQCPSGYFCARNHTCVAPVTYSGGGNGCARPDDCASGLNCGFDGQCHAGDCTMSGCPVDYVCKLAGGTPLCVPALSAPRSNDADGGGDSGGDQDAEAPDAARD